MLVMPRDFHGHHTHVDQGRSVDMVRTKNPIAMQAADKTDAITPVTRDEDVSGNAGSGPTRWLPR